MSHFTTVKTMYKNESALVAAMEELAFLTTRNSLLKSYYGQQDQKVDLLFTKGKEMLGIKKSKGSMDLIADWYTVKSVNETMIKRTYVKHAALQKLKSMGYANTMKQVDKNVVLTGTRM